MVLLRDADAAMYEAKARGRARSVMFDEAMRSRLTRLGDVGRALPGAVARGELTTAYQPTVHLESGIVVGLLVRPGWNVADHELLTQDELLRAAEDTGLIAELGEHIIRRACTDAALARAAGLSLRVSIPVSPRHVAHGDFRRTVNAALAAAQVDPAAVCLEVPAGPHAWEAEWGLPLQELREQGVHVAVNGFGPGSSIQYLREFAVDVLVLDRELVADVCTRNGRAIIVAMLQLGRALAIDVVADGVDTQEQLFALREAGCAYGQGRALGDPADIETALLLAATRLPTQQEDSARSELT